MITSAFSSLLPLHSPPSIRPAACPSLLYPAKASLSQSSVSGEASHQHQLQQQQQEKGILGDGKFVAAWREFAEHVSGEWDGYGAEFSSHGTPFELPSLVVPDAFRDWDVRVYDWQTQSPTLAQRDMKTLKYRLVRLLPTVGCEADEATPYSVDERHIEDTDAVMDILGFHSNGSYVVVWPGKRNLREQVGFGSTSKVVVHEGGMHDTLEVEHCLVEEGNSMSRVRIFLQITMQQMETNEMVNPILKKITVQREKWVSEFRNGEVLGGCSTSGSAFASTIPIQVSELEGTWHAKKYSAEWEPYGDAVRQLTYEGTEILERVNEEDFIALPTGLWSEFKSSTNKQFSTGAGWLVTPSTAVVSKCEFVEGGKLKRVILRVQHRYNSTS